MSGNLFGATRAFTLIEVIIVLGFLVAGAALSLMVSMDTYRGTSFRSERNLLIAALEHVRSQAVNAVCLGSCTDAASHGVEITPLAYVIFQGQAYASRDALFDDPVSASPRIAHSGSLEIVFTPYSGTSTGGTITLSDEAGHMSEILVSSFGQITWY